MPLFCRRGSGKRILDNLNNLPNASAKFWKSFDYFSCHADPCYVWYFLDANDSCDVVVNDGNLSTSLVLSFPSYLPPQRPAYIEILDYRVSGTVKSLLEITIPITSCP